MVRGGFALRLIAIFASLVLAANAQQVVLEDWSNLRTNGQTPDGTSEKLWHGMWNQGPTECSIVSGEWVCTTTGSSFSSPGGLGFWLNTLNCDSTGCYSNAGSYMKAYIRSGTWSSSINRLRTKYKCGVDVPGDTSGGGHWLEFGTYTRHITEPDPPNSGQGAHYYHFLDANSKANKWVWVELNQHPQHLQGMAGGTEWNEDPEWYTQNHLDVPTHYFDGMTHFYWGTNMGGTEVLRTAGKTCTWGPWTLDTVTGGSDTWVSSITGTYNTTSGRYELSFNSPKQIPGGATYTVRYSTSSMRTNGWSSGTTGGTTTGEDGSDYTGVNYQTPVVSEQTRMYIAVRPDINIASVSSTSPVTINTLRNHDLATGDTVNVTGLCATANGARTVTVVDRDTVSLGVSGACTYTSGSKITPTDETKNFAEMLVGDPATSSAPTVTTVSINSVTPTTASSGGNVSSDGGASVSVRGVCWSTTSPPTTSDSCTSNGTGTGTYTSSLTGLSASTLYYYVAYATNSEGTSYGTVLSFTTSAARSARNGGNFRIGGNRRF
jgi:hypothetical protein